MSEKLEAIDAALEYFDTGECTIMDQRDIPQALRVLRNALARRPSSDGEGGWREALLVERERCAQIAYATCASTRHVTLGDECVLAIRRQPLPAPPTIRGETK